MSRSNVLIVDDEPSIRIMLTRMLEPLNHAVSTAEDGQRALEIARQEKIDLIISDLRMPRMDGLTLLENLRRDGNDLAFIILTGYGELPQALAARERFNISDFLVKPIHNMDQFLFEVESALSRRLLERQNQTLMESLRQMNIQLEVKVDERTRELLLKNDELQRLSTFRADVLRVLGHELRTPLAILSGYHHLASQGASVQFESLAPRMGGSIERLKEIVERSLQHLKASERTQFPLEPEVVNPSEICDRVIERLSPFITSRRIRLQLPECAFREDCEWDREKMEEVIEELLINAVRASADNSRIDLSIVGDARWVEFHVKDYGVGVAEDQLERIFEPFVTLGKADHHTSGLFDFGAEGIGLGLSTAKMWADLHGGSIVAQSNTGTPGITLVLRVPRRVSSAAAPDEGVGDDGEPAPPSLQS